MKKALTTTKKIMGKKTRKIEYLRKELKEKEEELECALEEIEVLENSHNFRLPEDYNNLRYSIALNQLFENMKSIEINELEDFVSKIKGV